MRVVWAGCGIAQGYGYARPVLASRLGELLERVGTIHDERATGCAPSRQRVAGRGVSERVTRIELALSAWEADVLPLNYTRGDALTCAFTVANPRPLVD